MRRALVTGVAGQDGFYLSRLLLSKGYEVLGCGRPGTLLGHRGDEYRAMGVRLAEVDLLDRYATLRAIAELAPDEIYNLAGHSFVPESWDDPATAIRITSSPVIHLLDAIREVRPAARLYQSSTSEIFGNTSESPQHEDSPMVPANPNAAAKVLAHQLVGLYRRHHGLFACAAILHNHESQRRPPRFVTAKVAQAVNATRHGKQRELVLGDLDVTRRTPRTSSSGRGSPTRSATCAGSRSRRSGSTTARTFAPTRSCSGPTSPPGCSPIRGARASASAGRPARGSRT